MKKYTKGKWAYIALILLIPSISYAGNKSVSINLASYHLSTEDQFNETNLGAGLNYYKGNSFISVGRYYNSIYRYSNYLYVGKAFEMPITDKITGGVAVIAGVVSGYRDNLSPLILPRLHLRINNYQLNTIIIPRIKDVTPTTLGIQLEIFY